MGAVLGSLAFIMAFGSIWLTAEALRRVDSKGDALIKPYVRDIKARLADNRMLLAELDSRLVSIERQVEVLKSDHQGASDLAEQVDVVRYGLDQARSFKPSNVYNA